VTAPLAAALVAFALVAGPACADVPDDQLPMYGDFDRTLDPGLATADRLFVAVIVARYGGRREGSRAIAADAWRLFRGNDAANAMRLFNEAWIVDPHYYDVYWGFGAILLAQGQVEDAIVMLERANGLADVPAGNRAPLLGDLANLYALKAFRLASDAADRADYFARANAMFAAATTSDPANPQPWIQWVLGLFYEARYAEAWDKVAAARERGHRMPEPVLGALRAKHPEPGR
jgi:tetratricopeptide (TPR) repeat protein